jgi:hypothetical protein
MNTLDMTRALASTLFALAVAGPAAAATWSLEPVHTTQAYTAFESAVAIDEQGRVYVASPSLGVVRYGQRSETGTWSNETIDVAGYWPAPQDVQLLYYSLSTMSVSAAGVPWVAWANYNFQPHTPIHGPIQVLHPEGATWVQEEFESNSSPEALRVSTQGFPHLLYGVHGAVPLALRHGQRSESAWSVETIPSALPPAAMVLDAGDTPHVASTGSGELRYARRVLGVWIDEPIPLPEGATPVGKPGIAVGDDGMARVAVRVRYAANDAHLYHAVRGAGEWTGAAIEDAGAQVAACAIVVAPGGRSVIAFSDASTARIRVADSGASGWGVETVHDGIAPGHLSMASRGSDLWMTFMNGYEAEALHGTASLAGVAPGPSTGDLRLSVRNPRGSRDPLELWLDVPVSGDIRLEAFDAAGRRIAGRITHASAGRTRVTWTVPLPRGVAFLRATDATGITAAARVVTLE